MIYNPHSKPVEDLPLIYGFHNGGQGQWLHAQLLAEDGTPLGNHICSHEAYMAMDLGVTNENNPRHVHFREHYPDGYRMEFIGRSERDAHTGLQQTINKAKQLEQINE